VDWIELTQSRAQWWASLNTAMYVGARNNTGIFLTGRATDGFQRRALLHEISCSDDLLIFLVQ
jgi:hypothetical protein